ncbi:uncharacterized protein LOC123870843 [Maniola jurtina]|uniref:uncharacterized protein LOC123870843 n=1 Tax=Maniola jurtina TaxID=191418 RepID=UPI001E6867B0|nr:uncharacterized protein LOC123870843 [Maniola jurtina]
MCSIIDWNASYSQELASIKMHTDFTRDITIEKYRQLVPQKRSKRGLINPLGSIIKVITGNLDHDDAVKYDELTSKLNRNQIIISKKLTIVSKMLDSFINVTETMNVNSVHFHNRLTKVETLLKDLAAKQNNWIFITYLTGLFSVFTSSFRTIFVRLSEIETALALSKISILHQSIVNSTELLYHLNVISNSKTLAIIPKYPYLLAKGIKYLPLVKPCQSFSTGNQFLCTADNRALYYELTCIEQLMKFEDDLISCKQHQVQIEKIKVQQINPNSWLLYSRLRTTLTKRCGHEVSKQLVFGTYLITIDEPCELEIYGIRLHHRTIVESDNMKRIPIITLPQLKSNATLSGASVVNMEEISLDEVKYMAFSLKHSSVVESVLNDQKDSKFSVILGYLTSGFVVLSIFVFLFYIWLKSPKCSLFKKNHRNESKNDPSDNFPLRDGGVMARPSVLD